MTEIDELTHDDQVALWAGRVVRKEAEIESMLRMVYSHLCGDGLSHLVVPNNFQPLLVAVRTMIKAVDVPEDYRADCLAALQRLGQAHEQRNRVVHDQWVMTAPGSFTSAEKGYARGDKPEVVWDISDFEKVFLELRFCFAQIVGLYWSMHSYVGEHRELFAGNLQSNRESLAGRIALTSDNSWTFTDPDFIAASIAEHEQRRKDFLIDRPDWSIER